MLIVEFTLDHPILRWTLNETTDVRIVWEDSFITPDNRMLVFFWIENPARSEFESTLEDDSTVANPSILTEIDGRRLYQVEVVGKGKSTSIMPIVVDVGGVHLDLTATDDGWQNRIRFPSHDAAERVFEFCQENDLEFTIKKVYEESKYPVLNERDLTETQVETLTTAVESGYLDVPRKCSLAELGEKLGISESTASERFRRAVKALVREHSSV
jgi:predicted DNA binding protein